MDTNTNNLTPTLNDQEIRENITALQNGGLPNDQVQKYVDNYQKGTDGNYVLKGSAAQSKQTFSDASSKQQNTPGGFLGKVADFIGGSKIAQAAGNLINDATGGNQGVVDAAAQSGQIQKNVADQIIKDRTAGKDTTRLENALHALQHDTQESVGQEGNLSTGGVTNEEVAGSAVKLAGNIAGAAEIGGSEGLESGVLGKATNKTATGTIKGLAQGAKTGAISGAIAGLGNGAGDAMENNKSAGDVAKSGIVSAIASGIGGGIIGGTIGGINGAIKASKNTSKYIDDILTSDMTKKASASAISTGKVVEGTGLTGSRDFSNAIPGFDNIKASVEQVPGISPKKTLLQNVNLMHDAIGTTAQDLRNKLTNTETPTVISKDNWDKYISEVQQHIDENPLLVGDAQQTANKILAKFQSLLPTEGDITAEHVLDARQGLDKWIQSLKPNAFNPATENAVSTALRAVRQGANTMLADAAPDVAVKEMLNHQSNLYNAIDIIAPKAAKEEGTVIGRAVAKVNKTPILNTSIGGGLAAFGADKIIKSTTGIGF